VSEPPELGGDGHRLRGIYPTASAEEVEYQMRDGGAAIFVAEDQEYVDKILPLADRLPALGIQKVHAIMGGFHLGPAAPDYVTQVVAEISKLNPDVLIPMHCSGLNFTQEAQRQMPGKVLTTTTGTRITFSGLKSA
jgi:7,8-dihydropterin-6-yl-methyl-4-(beta-D-ribofuranosyl)aminobenzene 5'-phosphate synthase